MNFKTLEKGAITVLELEGNLMGGPDAASLNSKLHELIDRGKNKVIIDLKEVRFMNSSGLGLLLGGLTTVRNSGGNLKIANLSERISSLIKISKLSTVFEAYDSVDAAADSFEE